MQVLMVQLYQQLLQVFIQIQIMILYIHTQQH